MLNTNNLFTIVAALAAVVAIILVLSKGIRSSGLAARLARPAACGRMHVQESMALDRVRRLHLIRCDGRDVVLLTGGTDDVVVGWLSPVNGEQGL